MKNIVIPPSLVPGNTIAIVPTARAINQDEIRDGIALATSWGLKVRLGDGIGRKHFQQAGTEEERASDLQQAILDPEVKAVWCARGGYGTVHLLDKVDLSPLREKPKWIIGFSDVTVLHNALHRLGVASLHAQMPCAIGNKTDACRDSIREALFHGRMEHAYTREPDRPSTDLPANRPGKCEGPLVGGNLSVLYSQRGTPNDLDPAGKILFLEDLDELLYHMDRMTRNLMLGRWFHNAAGLIVGGMTEMRDKDPADPFGPSANVILQKAVEAFSYPVCYGFPAGHIGDNRALILGERATLNVTAKGASLSVARDPDPGSDRSGI